MCLRTLHDRVRGLGLGAMYEEHWAFGFRDLLDGLSAEWARTAVPEKVVALRAFESAGVPAGEIIQHYRETASQQPESGRPDVARVAEGLSTARSAYRQYGYALVLPEDAVRAARPPQ